MSIVAKRFKFLSEETNVGIASLLDATGPDLFNTTDNILKEVSSDLQAFAKNAEQSVGSVKNLLNQGSKVLDGAVRTAKDGLGAIENLASLPTKDLDKKLNSLLPNNSALAQSLFSGMTTKCKQNSFNFKGIGKPYDFSINCNGKNRKSNSGCNSGQMGNVLNKLSGGAYNSSFSDLNSSLKNLLSLSLHGYDLNMCGVFGALTTGMSNNNLLSRASAGILGNLASAKNTLGVLDLASSAAGLNTLLELPSGVDSFLTNFSIPAGMAENALSDLSDRVSAATELFSPGKLISTFDSAISMTSASLGFNSALDKVMTCSRLDNVFNEDDLDFIPSDTFTFASSAYSAASDLASDFFIA